MICDLIGCEHTIVQKFSTIDSANIKLQGEEEDWYTKFFYTNYFTLKVL